MIRAGVLVPCVLLALSGIASAQSTVPAAPLCSSVGGEVACQQYIVNSLYRAELSRTDGPVSTWLEAFRPVSVVLVFGCGLLLGRSV